MNDDIENVNYKDYKNDKNGRAHTARKLIKKAKDYVNDWGVYFRVNISQYISDYEFSFRDQWPGTVRGERDSKRKETQQVNYIKSICKRVIGEEIKNSPDPKIRPDPNVSTVNDKDAELIEGLVRKIFINNNFDRQKSRCFQNGIYGGYSVLCATYDWENPRSFYKKIKIYTHDNPARCFFDPSAKELTKKDGDYCGFLTDMPVKSFQSIYGKNKSLKGFPDSLRPSNRRYHKSQKMITICDIWCKEYYSANIVLLSNGQSMEEKEANKFIKEQDEIIEKTKALIKKNPEASSLVNQALLEPITIKSRRHSSDLYNIVHYKMTESEILESRKWPSEELPMVFYDFDSINLLGDQITNSYHIDAQGAQIYLNYLFSEKIDAIKAADKHGTWLFNIDNLNSEVLAIWKDPSIPSNIKVAKRDEQGQMPTFIPANTISQSLSVESQSTKEDIQNVMGQFDAGRGRQDNAISGVAIDSRARYGNINLALPFSNLDESIVQLVKIIVSLIPYVYEQTRMIGIKPSKGKETSVMINDKTPYGIKNSTQKTEFQITIDSSVSFEAQRAMAIAQITELGKFNPQLTTILADLVAENLDLINKDKIVNRVRETLMGKSPVEIISEEEGLSPPKPQPNPQAMMMQQEMKSKAADLKLKQEKQQLDAVKLKLDEQKEIRQSITEQMKLTNELKESQKKYQIDVMKSITELKKALLDAHVR